MKVIEVPVINEDGSCTAVCSYTAEEVQILLQFAANFMMGIGNQVVQRGGVQTGKRELND